MRKICPNCSRTNPAEAAYCYFDGVALAGNQQGGPVQAGTMAFASPFVFPNGEQCRNFNQLVMSCQNNWAQAREIFQQGIFEKFLQGMGRLDLAQSAQQAAQALDADRGLDQLLGALPADVLQAAKLQVEPTQVNLGQVKAGAESGFEIVVSNQGMRLLIGTVTTDCDWLTVGETPGQKQKLFQTTSDVKIQVRLKGQKIRAGAKPFSGRVIVDSNAGRQSVKVQVNVPILPFAVGVLEGARTPRELAQKARQHPKEAGLIFERGAVVEWYKANGWIYPVEGPTSSGLGAVQQYFEALGLARAPRVEISHTHLQFQGGPGEKIPFTLNVWTQDRKPVFAHATSDLHWVRFPPPQFQGAEVRLPIEMEIPQRPGDVLTGKITVVANGNQRFQVPIEVVVDHEMVIADGRTEEKEKGRKGEKEKGRKTERHKGRQTADDAPRAAILLAPDSPLASASPVPAAGEFEAVLLEEDSPPRQRPRRTSVPRDEPSRPASERYVDNESELEGEDFAVPGPRSMVQGFGMGRLVYWSALVGGWSAFVGWLVAELALGRWIDNLFVAVLMVVLVASTLGAGLSQVEGLLSGQWKSQWKHLGPGVLGGFVGGLLGGLVSNLLVYLLAGSSDVLRFFLMAVGWTLLGSAIGISEGVFELHWRKFRNGLMGGSLGGFLAGVAFFLTRYIDSQMTGRAIAFVLLGLFIGLFLSLVQVLLKEAWLTVEEGFRPGRQLILSRKVTTMGTSEKASLIFIAYGAKGVEPLHVRIRRQKSGEFVLEDNDSRTGTLLNGERIKGPFFLMNGDLIQFGINKVRFQERIKRVTGDE